MAICIIFLLILYNAKSHNHFPIMEYGLYKSWLIIVLMKLFQGLSNQIWFEENAKESRDKIKIKMPFLKHVAQRFII